MERNHNFIEDANRYLFDQALVGRGWHQLDSRQDAWYYGNWVNPATLEHISYAEGDVDRIRYDTPEEMIGHLVASRELLGLMHIDDWDNNWAVPIERTELEIYLSYMRDDMIDGGRGSS